MNKIFKVVWSKSKECYVVVSEFAKNNSGKKKIVVAGIFAALAMTNANVALAVNDVPASTGNATVALGTGTITGTNAVGLGKNVTATLNDVVVIGTDAKVESAGGGVAIGQNAYSKARYANTPSVAVGKNSIANGGTAVALGTGATVNEAGNSYSQGIAIGGGALPGQGAVVVGDQAIAIGGNTKALGHSSIVIGGDDADRMTSTRAVYTDITTGKPAVATVSAAVKALTGYEIKNREYQNATADHIGITVGTKGQSGNAGIAIGTGADSKNRIAGALTGVNTSAADNDSVTNAIAIGTGAKANRDNSVALGGGSTTDKPGTKQTSYTLPNGVVAAWQGGDDTLEGDIVSFGAAGFERQLKNVAPGEVSATSTDAINGSQLAAIANQITQKYVSIKSDVVPNKDNKGANADESIAIGPNASTDKAATSSVAIGDGARAITEGGVAIGSNSVADIVKGVAGYNPETGRTDTVGALNGATLTSKMAAVSVGSANQTRQIAYVAAGTADTDAVNVAQLRSVNLAFTGDTGSGDVNLANSKLAVNGDNTYIETKANGKKITIAGKKQDITVTNGVATATPGMADAKNVADAINQAVANSSSSWNLSANGEATTATVEKGNTVDFSGDDNVTVARNNKNISVSLKKDLTGLNSASFNNAAGNPTVKIDGDKGINAGDMKVTNVADGVADKDAVNVSQLKKTDDKAEANKAALARKISLDGNTGSTDEKSLSTGDVKFKIKGEDGITTVAAGDDVTVKLDTDTKNKIDNAANKDLSNLTPAGEQQVKDLAAWNVVANSETAEKVKGGDTVKFIDGDNVEITQAGKNFTISTKKDVTFDNVTANQAITAPKVKATTGVETPQVTGLTNTDWVPGQTQPVSGRAATEDQLKKVDDQVAANKDNITKNAGDIATNKADIAKNKDNIDKNTTAIARKISLGGNTGTTDEKSLSTGDVKFNVKGDNGLTTVANGDDVTVKLNDATKDKIDNAANQDLSNLTPAGKQQVKDLAAWNVVANGETAEKVQGGDTVKFINGDNIEITQAGKNFTIATKKDVTFDTVTANDTITAPKVKATTGVETPEVTGLTNKTWVPGQTQPVSGRAATEDQLKAVDDQVSANKDNITKNAGDIKTNKDNIAKNTEAIARKISLGGDTGSTDEKSLSTGDVKFNIKGQNGIVTEANGEDVTVKLDDATANKINNAANTDLSNLTDAGKQQVKDLSAWNVVANNGTAEKVEGGNTVKFIDGDNISITQNGKDFTVATKKDVTFDTVTANDTITAPKVKATDGVETPEVTGLTNKTWVPGQTQPVSGRAATEDQLKAVDDQVAANKDNITKNAGDIATNKANIAANKAQIDKNTEAIGRKISLGGNTGSTDEKSLSTGDVKFNIKGENGLTTVANGEDVTVKIDDATKAKIDNAANQDLSNLTDAGKQQVKDLSAWNVTAAGGTVEKVQGGDTVKFQAGDNLEVKQDKTTFTYSLAKDLKGLNSVTVGDENGPSTKITPAGTTVKDAAGNSTTVNGAGMTITPANAAASPVSLTVDGLNNGGNQIHGVAPGTADTDAVNVSQLKATKAGLQQAINNVGAETQRVGAHAAAMAALKPIQYDPLEPTQIMAGIGNYRGETAGAIGLAHYRTEDTMFNVGITLGSSHSMVNAGVTHKFGGSRDRKDAVPERYKAGPISSIYVMQDEVSHLRNQNEEYKSKLEQQQSEIDALKAAVNQLLANKA